MSVEVDNQGPVSPNFRTIKIFVSIFYDIEKNRRITIKISSMQRLTLATLLRVSNTAFTIISQIQI